MTFVRKCCSCCSLLLNCFPIHTQNLSVRFWLDCDETSNNIFNLNRVCSIELIPKQHFEFIWISTALNFESVSERINKNIVGAYCMPFSHYWSKRGENNCLHLFDACIILNGWIEKLKSESYCFTCKAQKHEITIVLDDIQTPSTIMISNCFWFLETTTIIKIYLTFYFVHDILRWLFIVFIGVVCLPVFWSKTIEMYVVYELFPLELFSLLSLFCNTHICN